VLSLWTLQDNMVILTTIVEQDLDQEHLSNDIGGRCDEIVM
jgi:hypothetical protein